MSSLITHSPAETEAIGEAWGLTALPGWVIALKGDLGAGKTQLVKGLARGLGTLARVHSPTFTLVNEYQGGRLPLYHLDLYRLETPDQISSAGLDDFLTPDGVTVVEWAERWGVLEQIEAAPQATEQLVRRVQIQVLGETDRRICYEDSRS